MVWISNQFLEGADPLAECDHIGCGCFSDADRFLDESESIIRRRVDSDPLLSGVVLVAVGYRWDCPKCDYVNHIHRGDLSEVSCFSCGCDWAVNTVYDV